MAESQIAFRIDEEVKQEFKKLCIDERKTLKEYVEELIRAELIRKRG